MLPTLSLESVLIRHINLMPEYRISIEKLEDERNSDCVIMCEHPLIETMTSEDEL